MIEPSTIVVQFERIDIKNDGDRFGPGEIYVRFAVHDGESYFEGRIPDKGVWKLNDGQSRSLEGPLITFEETVRDITIQFEVFDRDAAEDEPLGAAAAYLVHKREDGYRSGSHVHATADYDLLYTVKRLQ